MRVINSVSFRSTYRRDHSTSFECAIHAPACEYHGVEVIGHGVEADGSFYRCAHHASMAGQSGVANRARSAFLNGTPSRFREVVP